MSKKDDKFITSSIKWVNGIIEHDCKHVHDDCLPDFSCCNPSYFEKDINKRMQSHTRLIENIRNT